MLESMIKIIRPFFHKFPSLDRKTQAQAQTFTLGTRLSDEPLFFKVDDDKAVQSRHGWRDPASTQDENNTQGDLGIESKRALLGID